MRILVTGATGLLGNNLVRKLLADGEHRVRVLVRNRDDRSLAGLDVEMAQGDVRDAAAVLAASADCQAIIHSAAALWIGWTKLAEHRAINVEGTRNVVAAALARQARLLYVSTINTLGLGTREKPADEDSPREGKVPCTYVVTKREAEEVVNEAIAREGLDACVVHPGFMLGPWDWKPSSGRMLLEISRRWTPLAPVGGNCVCDVRDVTAGALAALAKGPRGRHYILGGQNLSYFDIWQAMARAAGVKGPLLRAGPLLRWIGGRGGDAIGWIKGQEGDVNSAGVAMSSQWHFYTSARAERELDYRVRPFSESLQDAWQWFHEHGYA